MGVGRDRVSEFFYEESKSKILFFCGGEGLGGGGAGVSESFFYFLL